MKIYEPGEKTHTQENFPVASYLIAKPHREAVLAFYAFARAADDVADHPKLSEEEKIAQLNAFESALLGQSDAAVQAVALRHAIARRQLTPRHAQDLLIAFRQDARKARYADWNELMHYCAYSAAPVGRFVLDVHGESPTTWPASDALCAALQIINHLQDCKADYMRLNRIYIPQDAMARHNVSEKDLAAEQASPGLLQCIRELAGQTQALLATPLSHQVRDRRLRIEVATIERLAHKLLHLLQTRDPLSQNVHLGKAQLLLAMARSACGHWAQPDAGQSARRSSFYTAMRIMPAAQRDAMYEIYRFCRAVDDIADDVSGNKEQRLAQWRGDIERIYTGQTPDGMQALADSIHRFGLQKQDFLDMLDGMEMDVRGPIQAPDMATLERYCERVACSVGRLSVRIFGLREQDGIALAHHLGMALQLTNILRDLDEDAALDRLYLPRELLEQAGIAGRRPAETINHPGIAAPCLALAEKAREHFRTADAVMQPYARTIVRAPRMMSQAYQPVLAKLTQRGFAPPRMPVRLNKARLSVILLRNLL